MPLKTLCDVLSRIYVREGKNQACRVHCFWGRDRGAIHHPKLLTLWGWSWWLLEPQKACSWDVVACWSKFGLKSRGISPFSHCMKPSIYNRKEIYLNCILERGFEDTCVFSLYVHVHRELLRGLLKDSTSSYNTLHKRLKNTVHSIQAITFHSLGYFIVQSINVWVCLSIWLCLKILIIITIKWIIIMITGI